ncbi:unnamed protein product [Zymoseptoria tritici ST99CH_3D1]|nr:unnamed protein product [Zymoseptoria tritici ST99CH_3D1]
MASDDEIDAEAEVNKLAQQMLDNQRDAIDAFRELWSRESEARNTLHAQVLLTALKNAGLYDTLTRIVTEAMHKQCARYLRSLEDGALWRLPLLDMVGLFGLDGCRSKRLLDHLKNCDIFADREEAVKWLRQARQDRKDGSVQVSNRNFNRDWTPADGELALKRKKKQLQNEIQALAASHEAQARNAACDQQAQKQAHEQAQGDDANDGAGEKAGPSPPDPRAETSTFTPPPPPPPRTPTPTSPTPTSPASSPRHTSPTHTPSSTASQSCDDRGEPEVGRCAPTGLLDDRSSPSITSSPSPYKEGDDDGHDDESLLLHSPERSLSPPRHLASPKSARSPFRFWRINDSSLAFVRKPASTENPFQRPWEKDYSQSKEQNETDEVDEKDEQNETDEEDDDNIDVMPKRRRIEEMLGLPPTKHARTSTPHNTSTGAPIEISTESSPEHIDTFLRAIAPNAVVIRDQPSQIIALGEHISTYEQNNSSTYRGCAFLSSEGEHVQTILVVFEWDKGGGTYSSYVPPHGRSINSSKVIQDFLDHLSDGGKLSFTSTSLPQYETEGQDDVQDLSLPLAAMFLTRNENADSPVRLFAIMQLWRYAVDDIAAPQQQSRMSQINLKTYVDGKRNAREADVATGTHSWTALEGRLTNISQYMDDMKIVREDLTKIRDESHLIRKMVESAVSHNRTCSTLFQQINDATSRFRPDVQSQMKQFAELLSSEQKDSATLKCLFNDLNTIYVDVSDLADVIDEDVRKIKASLSRVRTTIDGLLEK